ncbi:MAG: aldo/keto reductase [Myxococcales bacterium]|jgi:diketogulonate reductase-like aldo/keto reductase
MLTLQSTLKMNDGREIPRLGLGVYRAAPGKETRQAVLWALEAGYRLVDTARMYGNERDVGEALRASGLPRDEVFITTKLWNADQGYDSAIRACRASLADLGLEQIDLYLIHWPVERRRLDSWRALVQLQRDGLCRSIGVSNYTVRHLEELLDSSPVVPAVNQVEMSPFLSQVELRRFCGRLGIVVEAYSPLTKGRRLGDPTVVDIARAHGKSAAQVLIRWALQRDVVVIPKSVHKSRIEENADVFDFELTDEDLRRLDGLDEGLHTSWDPATAP